MPLYYCWEGNRRRDPLRTPTSSEVHLLEYPKAGIGWMEHACEPGNLFFQIIILD